jgi:CBS domain-containing protein
MAQRVADVMANDPIVCPPGTTVQDAARRMRDADVGNVLVGEGSTVEGIVTDRDIVVRALAEGRDPASTTVGEICSGATVTVAPDDAIDRAVQLMREHAVRRLPVVEGGRAVGVVSIGDLARERDERSALADISEAPPNA